MENKVVIALDAMGGDYAPVETVKGAVEAVNENKGMKVILVGREEEIKSELNLITTYPYNNSNILFEKLIDYGILLKKTIDKNDFYYIDKKY